MGRRVSEASPISSVANRCAESTPAKRRMVVPEFPQSSGAEGARRPSSPLPVMSRVPSSSATLTPMAWRAARVERLSSPREPPVTRLTPEASPAKRMARWAMLLSPGTGTLPTSGFCAGWMTRSVTRAL